jgi:hypothetical protein
MESTSADPQPRPALRFLFDYEGTEIRLLSRQSVLMVLPPTDPLQGLEGQAGFWYELRDATGTPLYRRIVRNPIQVHVEVHQADSASPTRRLVDAPQGVFTALVPDLPRAEVIALCSSPFTKDYGPVQAIATFGVRS